jgi:hypothetical protein
MVIADFSGDFLNAENTSQGSIVKIIAEGTYQEIERMGKTKTVLNIPVEVDGKIKTYTPSMESGKKFIKAWGADTVKWIGCQFTINIVNYKSFGETKKAVEADPIVVQKK